jgi:uncharacterized protein YbaR (Trm112 family)
MATKIGLVACPTCKGVGKVTLTVNEEHQKTSTMQMNCVICKGVGRVTQEVVLALRRFENSWCRCGSTNDPFYAADGEHTHCFKHHWDCSDCGGIVQIG